MSTSTKQDCSAEPYNKDLSLILHPDFDTCSLSASQQDKGALVLHKLSLFPFLQDWTDNYGAYINHAPFLIGLSIETPNRRREFTDITYNVLKCGMPSNGRRSFCKKDKLCAYCASVKGKNLQAKLLTNAPWTDGYRFYSLTYSYKSCFSLDLTTSDQLLHHWTLAKDYVQALYKSKLIHGYSLSEELAINNIQGAWVRPHSHFLLRCDQELSLAELPPVDPSVSLDLVEISTVKHYINQTHYMCKPLDYATQYQIELSLGAAPSFLNSQLQFLLERYLYTISKRRKVVSAGCFRPVYNRCVDRIPKARIPKKRVRKASRKSKSPTKELKPVAEVAKIEKDTDTDMNSEDIFNATTLQLKQAANFHGPLSPAPQLSSAVPPVPPVEKKKKSFVAPALLGGGVLAGGAYLADKYFNNGSGMKSISNFFSPKPPSASSQAFQSNPGDFLARKFNPSRGFVPTDNQGNPFNLQGGYANPYDPVSYQASTGQAFSPAELNNQPKDPFSFVPPVVDNALLAGFGVQMAAQGAGGLHGGASKLTPFVTSNPVAQAVGNSAVGQTIGRGLDPAVQAGNKAVNAVKAFAATPAGSVASKGLGAVGTGVGTFYNASAAHELGSNPLVDMRWWTNGGRDDWESPMSPAQRKLQAGLASAVTGAGSINPAVGAAVGLPVMAANMKAQGLQDRLNLTQNVHSLMQNDATTLAAARYSYQNAPPELKDAFRRDYLKKALGVIKKTTYNEEISQAYKSQLPQQGNLQYHLNEARKLDPSKFRLYDDIMAGKDQSDENAYNQSLMPNLARKVFRGWNNDIYDNDNSRGNMFSFLAK